MRRPRWSAGVAVALAAACGAAATAAAAPARYPPPEGRAVGTTLAQSLAAVLRPAGPPSWATPPVDSSAAHVVARLGARSAVVVPYRGAVGWCLGLASGARATFGWCTPGSGAHDAVEGGLVFLAPGHLALLARATGTATRLVVTLADGRAIPVALHHGIALSPLVNRTRPGDRPVWVAAIDRNGATIERRPLGWSAGGWRRLSRPLRIPKPPTKKQLAQLQNQAPCVGALSQRGVRIGVVIFSDRPSALLSAFIPNPAGFGEQLYVKADRPVHVTLVDGDGTRRPIPLGASRCAYVTLTERDWRSPFRLEARNTAGRIVQIARPSSWPGFPTDGA